MGRGTPISYHHRKKGRIVCGRQVLIDPIHACPPQLLRPIPYFVFLCGTCTTASAVRINTQPPGKHQYESVCLPLHSVNSPSPSTNSFATFIMAKLSLFLFFISVYRSTGTSPGIIFKFPLYFWTNSGIFSTLSRAF